MGRKYVIAWHDWADSMEELDDAAKGRLFVAILKYSETGVAPVLQAPEKYVWPFFKVTIDRDAEAYEKTVAANRENGKKGGRPKKPKESELNPENPFGFLETEKSQYKDKDKDEYKDEDQDGVYIYSPPTLEQITAYCWERAPHVNPQNFMDYYEAAHWSDENGRPINWKRKALIWEWTAKNKQDRIPDYIDEEDDK